MSSASGSEGPQFKPRKIECEKVEQLIGFRSVDLAFFKELIPFTVYFHICKPICLLIHR